MDESDLVPDLRGRASDLRALLRSSHWEVVDAKVREVQRTCIEVAVSTNVRDEDRLVAAAKFEALEAMRTWPENELDTITREIGDVDERE